MNSLTIIGRLVANPETKSTQDGRAVCNFTIAVNRRQKNANGQNEADFFRVSAWGQLGENCQKYLAKGRQAAVVGSVSAHAYTAQDGSARAQLDVVASNVEFLGKAEEGGQSAPEQSAPAGGFTPVENDELPF